MSGAAPQPKKKRKRVQRPIQVVSTDQSHLRDLIKKARQNEDYWRGLGWGTLEDGDPARGANVGR